MKAADKIPATENLFRMERCKRFLDKHNSKVELTLCLESEILLHKIMFQRVGVKLIFRISAIVILGAHVQGRNNFVHVFLITITPF